LKNNPTTFGIVFLSKKRQNESFMSFLSRFFGSGNNRQFTVLEPLVAKINSLEADFQAKSAAELAAVTAELKARLGNGETLDELLPEAFAAVREASRRTLGQRHYDVQLLGGIILHQGKIAEMRTGEGKTLVCTLPAYLNALAGQGVHVITVNDYLARRDAVWMGQIYAALGMTVGVINHESSFLYDATATTEDSERDAEGSFKVFYEFLKTASRREAYLADITYGTNNEFGFDYLRDNLAHDPSRVVQLSKPTRLKHHYAIVDEVDSILIDEARTPLIISAPVGESESLYGSFAAIAASLVTPEDYTIDEKTKSISLTGEGITKAEKALGVENIYTERGIKYVHHLETAVRAKALYQRDKEYVVRNDEIIIVDEFTGRLQPGRRWSEGLHQAVEAKEGVRVQEESRTFASVTFQNYFKLYGKLAGMTGTAQTSAEEFMRVYGLDTLAIPTHRPTQRLDHTDLIFQSEAGKFKAISQKIKELNQRGQPVLVGTVSIEKNELLSAYLRKEGVPHRILNAKNNEEEGAVIAEAGKKGSVVIATNMAGRGVDIKLGGPEADEAAAAAIKALGGLFVLGTERHEARRIDNQLRGRSGRQGDPGETQFYISLDDELARIFAPEKIKKMMTRFGIPEDEPIQNKLVSRAIESAQTKIEGLNFDLRKHLLDYDNVLNTQRSTIYGRRHEILFGGKDQVDKFIEEALAGAGENEAGLRTQLQAKSTELGENQVVEELKRLILQVIDLHWVDHLEAMEYLRGSVRLRAYGQRDPLIEYRREGLLMFKDLEDRIYDDVVKLLPNIGAQFKEETLQLRTIHESVSQIGAAQQKADNNALANFKSETKVGRNDPCPCGSGKKWKKCGELNTPEHQRLLAQKSV
jgi:preprotein translocase subunit SecA